MTPRSHTLFHFTKNSEILKQILKGGFWPRYCLEDVNWLGSADIEFVAFPMVCFCDIPLSRVDEHVGFYGDYGIGLTKEWAESNGLTPIHYIAQNSGLPSTYKRLEELFGKHESENIQDEESENKNEGWALLRFLLAHIKPLDGRMMIGGNTINKEFHQESEWRYVPKHELIHDFILRENYNVDEFLAGRNNETKKHCMLKLTPRDVKYIFVKRDSDIPDMINFIQAELDTYPAADIKVLLSRVTSLESISRDL